ncbi:MAG TPA: GntR family transcriptional regulator [Pseudonocardiaceae bacterium]|nr:GntR family transcriptional regulator [Pseudonocardiaceae bacterium]
MDVLPSAPKTVALYEQLRGAVAGGNLLPGSRLSEVDLCRQYKVSRTPIREALARLEQDGLIERRGSALFVRDRSADEIIDIYRVRVYLEGAIAFDAAHRRSETDLMRLEAAAAVGAELEGTEDPVRLQTANTVFHQALAVACHNQTLQDLQSRLTAQVAKLPSTTLSYPGRWQASIGEHLNLVDAIRKQDGELARTIGSSHMRAAAEIRSQLIARELNSRTDGR